MKQMSTLKFMKKKNKILKKLTGITLIPKDQLVEVPALRLGSAASAMCPYCLVYLNNIDSECGACPMNLAGNQCDVDSNNTFNQVIDALPKGISGIHKLDKLVKKFNKSNGFS